MEFQSLRLICFSPTGTTKAIGQAIARGINPECAPELIDITKPEARKLPIQTSENELLIVAVPVYMGRVPALLGEWLSALKAHHTPVVCVVVYGNRAYDNALLELKDIMTKAGGIPIAGAAYIGEHSFSGAETPIAAGRPDVQDLNHAELFGRKLQEKLCSASSREQFAAINLPGNYPYGGVTELWSVDFIAVSDECTQCGICAEKCPVQAVDSDNSSRIDREKCITCCACVKNCPRNARTIKPSPVQDAALRLNTHYRERKEPAIFW